MRYMRYMSIRLTVSELYESTFQPMEDAILEDVTTNSKLTLLIFYKNLLDRWTTSLLSRHRPATEVAPVITSLINHANILSLTIVQTSQSVDTFSTILSFYEAAAATITYPTLKSTARITTPPAELIYTLHFSASLSTLSRLCAILALYKRAFEIAMAPKLTNPSALDLQSYPKEYVNHFNGFLMDVCNCLWRARALNTTDPNALGCLVPSPITLALSKYVAGLDTSLTLPSLFGFSTSPTFCLFAISYIRELEDAAEESIDRRHAGPVLQASLKQLEMDGGLKLSWQDYKLGVLQYMENKGAAGVGELMYNTMKHLMAARNNRV
jgi:centromere protein I